VREKKSPPGVGGQGARKALGLSGGVVTRQSSGCAGFLHVRVMLRCSIKLTYLHVNDMQNIIS
jgi:hypothetical protein